MEKKTTIQTIGKTDSKDGKVKAFPKSATDIEIIQSGDSFENALRVNGEGVGMWQDGCHKHISVSFNDYIDEIDYNLSGCDIDKVTIQLGYNNHHPYLEKVNGKWILTFIKINKEK